MLIKQNNLYKDIKYNTITTDLIKKIKNDIKDEKIQQLTNHVEDIQLKRVFLIQEGNNKFIFKHTIEKEVLDRTFTSLLLGGFYARLFHKLNKIKEQDITAKLFCVIEKRIAFNIIETFMLYEYIEGKTLGEIDKKQIKDSDIINCIDNLHKYKLVSGDINPNNFIKTADKLKIIDLSSRNSFYFGRIKDIIDLKIIYNIDYPIEKNFLYNFIKWKKTRK